MKKNTVVFGCLILLCGLVLSGCSNPGGADVTPVGFNFEVKIADECKQYCKYADYTVRRGSEVVDGFDKVAAVVSDGTCQFANPSENKISKGDYTFEINFYSDSSKQYKVYKAEELIAITSEDQFVDSIEIKDENKVEGIKVGVFGKDDGNNPKTVFYVADGTKLFVFGSGQIYESNDCEFKDVTECFIDEGITSIATKAFYHSGIKKLTGGNSVTEICTDAFKFTEITDIDGFNSIDTITGTTFGSSFSKFKTLKGLNGVTSLPANAFSNCTGLKEIDGFNNVTDIGKQAFLKCKGLEKVNGFAKVITIGKQMFSECSSLTTLTGFDSLESIGELSFSDCTSLRTIASFDKVKTIGVSAFLRCYGLVTIDGFNSAETLGEHAFEYCTNLETVKGFKKLTSFGAAAFNECGKIKTVEGFNSVKETPENAFIDAYYIESISGFDSVEKINDNFFLRARDLPNFKGFYYGGTCEQFAGVSVPVWELRNRMSGKVYCSDGKYTGTIKA